MQQLLRQRWIRFNQTVKRSKRQKRNPFASEGWGRFIMRSIRADEAARAAARARVAATGQTLHYRTNP
jgi:hypothetical protein